MRFLCAFGRFLSKRHQLLANSCCCLAFAVQFGNVLLGYIDPAQRQTNINIQETNLEDMAFPVILHICFNPGFNETVIKEAGYANSFDYFSGQSAYNRE